MLEKKYIVSGIRDLEKQLPVIKEELSAYEYNDGVIAVYTGNLPEEDLKDILRSLKENFPKLKITGMSSAVYANYYGKESVAVLGFVLMKEARAELFHREFDRDSESLSEELISYARELREKIRDMENVKSIELYFAWLKSSSSDFIRELSEGLEDIPVFGAISGVNSLAFVEGYTNTSNGDSIVIADETAAAGVSLVVYSGKDLYVYEDYLFGWKPVGRYLDVKTKNISSFSTTALTELDGEKATDVYDKYLGVKPNKYFVPNISEFPLVIERNGIYIGRTPSGYGEKGEVYLEGDILPGERVRFSYGEKEEILSRTVDGVNRMKGFGAERLALVICGNRFNFLQEDAHLEIDYYSEGRACEPVIILGMGEIYRYGGKGGVLNSALVAVGMREGLGEDLSSPVIHQKKLKEHKEIVPLAERLSHFLKAMTGELVEAVKDAKSASEAKSAFLSNMSHEIRTPINAVLGMDEIILREAEDKQILEYAHNIKMAGNTLLSLVNDILDFSKIEAGKMDIIPVDYDFSSVLNDLFHMIEPRARAKGLELIFDIDKNIPSLLNGDELRIKQVMTNILTNAVKYTEEGSITLEVAYEKISDAKLAFEVSVKDTGIGIKPEDLEKLYGAFQRVDEERNRNVEGTGLGLNIASSILALMGSHLRVKSTYGEGTEFSFRLEQRVVKWDPVGDYMEAYKRALSKIEKYKERFRAPDAEILVIDDMPMNLTVFEGLLKKTKIKIHKGSSGKECLEKTMKKKYDLIFLDHRMPEMDGIETLQALRGNTDNPNRATKAICLTANAVSGSREMYMEAGFDGYLTKPIMSDKLETLMINMLPKDKIIKVWNEEMNEKDESRLNTESLPEWLLKVKELKVEEGIENCGGSELYIEAVRSFKENYKENFKMIKEYFEAGDIKAYTIKVHALKSSARIIGANELSGLSARLERAGDMNDTDLINKESPILLDMYKELSEKLEEDREEDDLELMGEAELTEAFKAILELSENYDYDSIKYIADTIKSHRIPEDKKEATEALLRAVGRADWEEIKKIHF